MSRVRIVGGTIAKHTVGKYNMYAEENIVFHSDKVVSEKGDENGVVYKKPKKHKPLTDIKVLKVEGPFDENGKLVNTVEKGKYYTYKASSSRKPNDVELKMLKWATQNDNDKIIELLGVSSHNTLKNDKIIISIAINQNCEKAHVYAYFKKASDKVRVSVDLEKKFPMLILQGSRRKGKNRANTSIADDMLYNDYPENSIGFERLTKELYDETYNVEKQDSFYNATSRADNAKNKSEKIVEKIKKFSKKSSDDLFVIFKDDIEYFSSGDIETVAKAMVDKMKKNEGGEYTNDKLTQAVINHANSKTFITSIKKVIVEYLKDNKGIIDKLEITDDSNGVLYNLLKRDKVDNPKFSDKFSGLGITINDVWAYQVFITDYSVKGNRFEMSLEYIYWDHFGLDYPDIQKYDNDIFYSWFVLQHFRGYKPFLTKIDIVGEIKGEF